ncbi:hypothetical protein JCM4814A_37020 [Streptomyces phaeofaciens JCM 4814]|uniref:Lipoprotein n=1 Tax=Streptomyces phaeofaciens TaxID=68254 RepID=A0A918HFY7_9ACTN|nr:hypothetical protein [Streptomyces phaeofaciens]GGT59125.1 hypothetical protein GCM10010226_40540 [Streptomyces phaeofaciens]
MSQQSQRGTTGRSTSTARLPRGAALVAGLALLLPVTACGGGTGGAADAVGNSDPSKLSAAPAAGVVAPARVEVIAGLIGCEAEIRTDADELREGTCHAAQADYLITTFPAEKFKLTWLDAAAIYGGTYLVGPQWVVSAKPELLEQARDKVGGNIQQLRGMSGSTPAPSAS